MLIEERPHPTSVGVQRLHRFDNNYGASVIRAIGSYGYEDNLWELAVLKFEGSKWTLCYDTPICSRLPHRRGSGGHTGKDRKTQWNLIKRDSNTLSE